MALFSTNAGGCPMGGGGLSTQALGATLSLSWSKGLGTDPTAVELGWGHGLSMP